MATDWWTPTLIISLFIMICALASAVDITAFIDRLKKPKGIIIGLICQYGFLPLIAFFLCYLFNFDYETSIALILTSTCPGGILSNFFAFTIGADLPLSIAMTTASSLLSFAFIPLNSYLYIRLGLQNTNNIHNVKMDWGGLMISIFVLIAGIIIGLIFAWKKCKIAQKILAPLATLSLLFLIITSLIDNLTSEYPLYALSWKYYIAPLILTTIGWIFGLFFALILKLEKPSAVAVGIETSNQSTGVAIAILALSISNMDIYDRVVSIPGIYTLLTWLVNGIFVVIFLKFGWVDQQNDESITCCTLMRKYKNRNIKNDEIEMDEQCGENENINIQLKNTDEFDGKHKTNTGVVVDDDEEGDQQNENQQLKVENEFEH